MEMFISWSGNNMDHWHRFEGILHAFWLLPRRQKRRLWWCVHAGCNRDLKLGPGWMGYMILWTLNTTPALEQGRMDCVPIFQVLKQFQLVCFNVISMPFRGHSWSQFSPCETFLNHDYIDYIIFQLYWGEGEGKSENFLWSLPLPNGNT